MLLVHKPPTLPMSPLNLTHRRHPSAPPAVVVQATKTPGILSLSKPLRTSTPRQHQQQQPQSHQPKQHRSPRPKQLIPQSRPSQPSISEAQPSEDSSKLKPSASSATAAVDKKSQSQPATPSPEKHARGRQQAKPPKDKTPRSDSVNAHARRNNIRQPSPPLPSSQVEGSTTTINQPFAHRNRNPALNSFDPFIVNSDSDSDNAHPATTIVPSKHNAEKGHTILSSQPSGKLARRRNNAPLPPATPTPQSRAVPVPRIPSRTTARHMVSRSAPINSTAPMRPINRRTSATFAPEFPICDDMTDVDDNEPPSTPVREKMQGTWKQLALGDGPRTAPLRSTAGFPFGGSAGASPSPSRRHYRTPSEGVFNMSFDEDMASTSDASEELKKLFGMLPKRYDSVGPNVLRAGKDKAGFFASSVFQNSPSPDELPPPAF
ncbi:hypothetical protein BJ138DRAFT_261811 [Hygrophoropsis aurantiaca]|uniref:Uncharacterized protein n=1 Tax=Hygrophoropsis aurantiaca TaxID=72124 RepID=A0ACB8A6M5_9AGAM|nr:hypothetical protein BJ138DRAFT_261811 [Hygrophoropsis aurantiaca]